MTGYEDLNTPELTVAVRTTQKMVRKLLYSEIYKAQATNLARPEPLAAANGGVGMHHVLAAAPAVAAAPLANLAAEHQSQPLPLLQAQPQQLNLLSGWCSAAAAVGGVDASAVSAPLPGLAQLSAADLQGLVANLQQLGTSDAVVSNLGLGGAWLPQGGVPQGVLAAFEGMQLSLDR